MHIFMAAPGTAPQTEEIQPSEETLCLFDDYTPFLTENDRDVLSVLPGERPLLDLRRSISDCSFRYLLTGRAQTEGMLFSLYAEYREGDRGCVRCLPDLTTDPEEAMDFTRGVAKGLVYPRQLEEVYEDVFF